MLDIDEAGYLGMAINYHGALLRDGLPGWAEAIQRPGIQAPLTPALTSLQFLATGTYAVAGFIVPLLAGLATVLLTYGLAHRIGGRRLAWPAMLLVAAAPGVIVEARAYHFGGPAAAITMAALYCLVRTERMSKTGFTVAFGLFLGLMPLTRTMTFAYVPALVLAGLILALLGPDRGQRLLRWAGALVIAVGVAALWLAYSGSMVFRYLAGFGYGAQSRDYGLESGLVNPGAWRARFSGLVADQHLPHVLIVVAGICVAIFVVVARSREVGPRGIVRQCLESPLFPPVLLVAGGYAALLSSSNAGQYFALPLFPPLIIIAVWALFRVLGRVRMAIPAVVGVVVAVALVPMLDLRAPTARPWTAEVPVLGGLTITDGRGSVHIYEGRGLETGATEPISSDLAQQWIAVSDWAAKEIIDREAVQGTTAFGFRDRLFNTNTVQLALLQSKGYGVRMAMINPTEIGETKDAYERWLTLPHDSLNGDASPACLLFTATGTFNEFIPAVNPEAMADAAGSSGFAPLSSRPLPNGRMLTLWHRSHPTCG